MNSQLLEIVLAMAPPAGQGQQGNPPALLTLLPMMLVIVIFYLILIRPQQKKAKELETMIKSLKPGDKVVAGGGIVGVVVSVKDRTVCIRSEDAKFEVLKTAVTDITDRANGPASKS